MFKKFYARTRATYREIARREAVKALGLEGHYYTLLAAYQRSGSEVLRRRLEALSVALYSKGFHPEEAGIPWGYVTFSDEIACATIAADKIAIRPAPTEDMEENNEQDH